MNKVYYNISNMANSECRTQIKNALDKVKGVQKVGVSLKTGSVAVDYNAPADEDQIQACIKHTGFTIL